MGDKKTILIVGRSGNGKTSLAKTISGLQTCKIHHLDVKGDKQDPYLHIEQYDGTRDSQDTQDTGDTQYNVLVCSFIGDNEEDSGCDSKTIKIAAEKTLRIGETGGRIDAVVFAMKYGVRFTKQESDSVDIVERLFGEQVFAEHVVIAFSYGDLFEYDKDMDAQEAFKEWCIQQQGSVKRLFEDVKYRCVLFNNKVKHQAESLSQLKTCIEKINTDKDLKLQVDPIKPIKQISVKKLKKQNKSQRKQLKKQHKSQSKKLKKQHGSKVQALNDQHKSQIKEIGPQKQSKSQVKEREKQKKTQKNKLKEENKNELNELKQQQQNELEKLKQQQQKELDELKQQRLKSSAVKRNKGTTTTKNNTN